LKLFTRKTLVSLAAVSLALSLSGCTYFSKDAQDKAACDKISEILVQTGQSADYADTTGGKTWGNASLGTTEAYVTFADRIENEALPLSSMSFSSTIQRWVKALRKLDSQSVFDIQAGYIYTFDGLADVNARCVSLAATY